MIIHGGDRACVRLLLELRSRISGLPGGTVIHLIASNPGRADRPARLVPPDQPLLPRPGPRRYPADLCHAHRLS